MKIDLAGVLRTAAKVLGTATGIDLSRAADLIGGLPPEKRAELDLAMQAHERDMRALEIEELKQHVTESLTMLQSGDTYVKRARPTMLYAATAVTTALCLIVGAAILFKIAIEPSAVAAVVSLMTPLWGAGGYYIHSRTKEKMNGGGQ